MSWTAMTQAPTDEAPAVLVVEHGVEHAGRELSTVTHEAGGDVTAWDVEAASQLLLSHGWRLLGPWEAQDSRFDAPRMHYAPVEPAPTDEARVPTLD